LPVRVVNGLPAGGLHQRALIELASDSRRGPVKDGAHFEIRIRLGSRLCLCPGSACAPAEGEPLLQETLAGYETVPDSWRRYDTQSMFGAGLAGQGKYAEAEAQLLSGYRGLL